MTGLHGLKALTALLVLAVLAGCSSGKNTIFIVDTSGSMKKDRLIDEVKTSVRKIVEEAKPGDRLLVYSFDVEPRLVVSADVQGRQDVDRVAGEIDKLAATGPWTDLQSALDQSLKTTMDLLQQDRSRKTVLVLYTDGHDDPPPGEKRGRKLDFEELFRKYYTSGKSRSWFIYYVELAQPEPELKAFLARTGSGKVISRGEFLQELNIVYADRYGEQIRFLQQWGLYILGGLLVLLLWLTIRRYRALQSAHFVDVGYGHRKGETEVKTPEMIWLGTRPAVMFKYFIDVGSNADVKISGPGVSEKHARIKASLLGRFFVRPASEAVVKVDGNIVSAETEIKPGQKIQIGSREFVFGKKK